MTPEQLGGIMPQCPHPAEYAGLLSMTMVENAINTVTRAAAFLGQLAHESGELRLLEEQASGAAYEGRDGRRFKGRGFIQITGRDNYRAAGLALGLDLTEEPWQASDPAAAAKIAGWFWAAHGCNELADALDFSGTTRQINGGLNGYSARFDYYHRALEVLGRTAPV